MQMSAGDTKAGGSAEHERGPRIPMHAIRVRRPVLVDALAADGLDPSDQQRFRTLCNFLGAYFHHEFYARLSSLKDLHARLAETADPSTRKAIHAELERDLVDVLKQANFEELDRQSIVDADDAHPHLEVRTRTPHEHYETARIFCRGVREDRRSRRRLMRTHEWREDVLDDVVIYVRFRDRTGHHVPEKFPGTARHGSLLIKSFRNVARNELPMLLPGVEVVMSRKDAILIGGPALLGGIPVALNILPALSVMLVLAGAMLGISGTVQQDDMMKAVGALSALVGAGAFMFRQYASYAFRKLRYQKRLADNVYFRNVNNDTGVLDSLIGAAEDQETTEVILAYHALLVHGPVAESAELDRRIEAWLDRTFGLAVDFEVEDALAKLRRLGFLSHDGVNLSVPGLSAALSGLDTLWDRLYDFQDCKQAAGA